MKINFIVNDSFYLMSYANHISFINRLKLDLKETYLKSCNILMIKFLLLLSFSENSLKIKKF